MWRIGSKYRLNSKNGVQTMTYYVAEIRFNRTNRNLKRNGKTRKRLTMRLITLLLVTILFSASIMIISVAACQRKRPCENRGENEPIIESLQELYSEISDLPNKAFENPCRASCQRKVLCTEVCVVIQQVKVGAYEGALNKLKNDIKEKIERWIVDPWKGILVEKVERIIELLRMFLCRFRKPPMILSVLRYPETPNYDEPVTVIAQVVDKQSRVKSVILSYQVNSSGWTNTTMSITDGLYVAEIPPQPYDSAVNYKIYAYDWTCNLAISETYSYVVIDSHPPVISCVYHTPPSPNYNETVSVFATVTEPPNASGVQSVTLNYWNGSVWAAIAMTRKGDVYNGTIPSLAYGTEVKYWINASDYAGNWIASCVYSYVVCDRYPPRISIVSWAETPNYDEPVTIKATVVDEGSGIESVILYYSTNSIDWMNMPMNPVGDSLYMAEISPEPYGTTVIFYVYASDVAGNSGVSQPHFYTVIDSYPPTISDVEQEPTSPNYNETVTVSAVVTEPKNASQVGFVFLSYWDGSTWRNITMTLSNGRYVATIPALPYGTVANYKVYGFDRAGNLAVSDVYSYSVTDRYPPTARIDKPTEGSYLSGKVYVTGFGSDVNFDKMQLYINGNLIKTWTEAGEWIYLWDTTTFGDGPHTIKLVVYDKAGNTKNETVTITVDNTPPLIGTPTWSPEKPSAAQEVTVNVTVTDLGSGIKNVTLWYRTDEEWQFVGMASTNGYWTAVIPGQSKGVTVRFYIEAYDNAGNSAKTETYEYTVKAPTPFPLALLAAIGLGIAALTATLLYALYRRRKRGRSAATANPGNKPKPKPPVVTLYIPAKILSRFEIKPLKLRRS
jgi:hypothetical protein